MTRRDRFQRARLLTGEDVYVTKSLHLHFSHVQTGNEVGMVTGKLLDGSQLIVSEDLPVSYCAVCGYPG